VGAIHPDKRATAPERHGVREAESDEGLEPSTPGAQIQVEDHREFQIGVLNQRLVLSEAHGGDEQIPGE
jgi:hypothetical protein